MLRTINKIKNNFKFIKTFTTINTDHIDNVLNTYKTTMNFKEDSFGIIDYKNSMSLKKNGINVIIGTNTDTSYNNALNDGWIKGINLFEIKKTTFNSSIVQDLLYNVNQHNESTIFVKKNIPFVVNSTDFVIKYISIGCGMMMFIIIFPIDKTSSYWSNKHINNKDPNNL